MAPAATATNFNKWLNTMLKYVTILSFTFPFFKTAH